MAWFPPLLKFGSELLSRLRPTRPRVVNQVAVFIRNIEVKLAVADPLPPGPGIPEKEPELIEEIT